MSAEAPYPVHQVLISARFGDEAMGTKKKFWCHDERERRWLFKFSRPDTGEHWSEKIAAEVGAALGVPCANVELAECGGLPGSLTESFVSKDSASLVHGNELLQEVDASYPTYQFRGVSKHTVDAVLGLLARLEALGEDEVEKITARVPASAISEPGRTFAREVLRLGRRMLLDPAHPTPPHQG